MNGNNQNPKGGYNPNAHAHKGEKYGNDQKHGQHNKHDNAPKHGQAAGHAEQKKNGWCANHKGPKAKCNCE
jgi:hypothetical protein